MPARFIRVHTLPKASRTILFRWRAPTPCEAGTPNRRPVLPAGAGTAGQNWIPASRPTVPLRFSSVDQLTETRSITS